MERIEAWAGALLARLDPGQRRALARRVGIALRRSQSQRIGAQQNPDGSAYEPRKERPPLRGQRGRVRRQAGAMMRKLRQARLLKVDASADQVAIGYAGAAISRVARVHQGGLRDRVERKRGAPEVTYPKRVLLGFTEADSDTIMDMILEQLQA